MESKECSTCKAIKLLSEFSKHIRMKDGHSRICKDCHKQYDKDYYTKSKEAISKRRMEAYYGGGKERVNTASKKYYSQNKAKFAQKTMARHAAKRDRTPEWLTKAHVVEMEGVYEYCKIFNTITPAPEGKLVVDHIAPLRGKKVSGLHVPWNLQVLTCRENAIKSNNLGHLGV